MAELAPIVFEMPGDVERPRSRGRGASNTTVPIDRARPDWLKVRLPTFMLPAHVTWRESLPRNPNGKIDRKRLSVELAGLFEGVAT